MTKRMLAFVAIVLVGAAGILWLDVVLHAQQAAAAVPDPTPVLPPVPVTSTTEQYAPSLMWALVIVPVLNWAKKNPKIAVVKDATVFWASGAAAVLGQAGIHFAFNSVTGTFTVTGLTTQAAHVVFTWASQHVLYRHLKALDAISKVAEALAKAGAATG